MKKIVILTGAGISAESGIKTFRAADGLWEGHDVMEVASPQGWSNNCGLVLAFYNQRRAQLNTVKPNAAHVALAKLEEYFEVCIITQNVDDLHERGGSKRVVHLHGELLKARSSTNPSLVYNWPKDIKIGDQCEEGSQLRPHIVWFGESVPLIEAAAQIAAIADIFIVIGTSMQVYPAAGLIACVNDAAPKFYVDPHPAAIAGINNIKVLPEAATVAVPILVDELIEKYAK